MINQYATSVTARTTVGLLGHLQMFCFEKTLRTGAGTATVSVGYENNLYHVFKCIERKGKPYITEFDQL